MTTWTTVSEPEEGSITIEVGTAIGILAYTYAEQIIGTGGWSSVSEGTGTWSQSSQPSNTWIESSEPTSSWSQVSEPTSSWTEV